jgi:O-succinylhomoserine sulfhydrylase
MAMFCICLQNVLPTVDMQKMKFETLAIRLQTERTAEREHSTPIFPTSGFVFDDAEQMRAMFADEQAGNIYSRFTNPNNKELEDKIAALEQTEDAVSTASGMAAIFASFLSLLKSGDHLIASRAVFGSTHTMLNQYLPKWGIDSTFVDPVDQDSWHKALRPTSKMFFVETPSNPGLDIIDLEAAKRFCEKNRLILNVDNCFATPYLQQPSRWGADLITHSATKYIDGQGRVLGGIVAGRKDLIAEVKKMCRSTGPSLSPFNAWILSKSLETLAVRMDRHCDNAEQLAQFLLSHAETTRVRYPFLKSHPAVDIARRQMKRGGGLVTFDIKGGLEQGKRFLDALQMLSLTANLGDTRSIATHPASTTHAKLTSEARAEVGITDGLIRISAGLEHIDDILQDIGQALIASAQ